MTDQASFLFGGSVPAAFQKDDPIGTRRGGVVSMDPEIKQQTDFDTDEPLTWKDGSPRMQMIVTVQTDLRDPANPDDDGQRRFYVRGKQQYALAAALKAVGANKVEQGGELYFTFTGEEPNAKNPRLNPTKLYSAEYVKPNPQAQFLSAAGDQIAQGFQPQQFAQGGVVQQQWPAGGGGYQQAPPQQYPQAQQIPQGYGGQGAPGNSGYQLPPQQQAPPVQQQQAPIQPPSQQQAPNPAAGFDTSNLPPEALALLQNMQQNNAQQ
ncbi:hypothetical protein [Rhodococcus opacus]|uniref:Uncharacterized protein n=1 Tax=Rhodococcus opacus (strain B4) TaxID=632772 RepID=C1B9B3_RHOOB|nr:hypothetical protein [Rhodococcus opacus]BAH52266.1 hypothetical protein ROP_40190 [Rhodococcus opacus B4]